MRVPARRSLLANFAAVMAGQLGTWLLTATTLMILPRYLGPTKLGDASIGATIATLASVGAGFGIATLATREVAKGNDEDGSLSGLALVIAIASGLAAGMLAFVVAIAAGYRDVTLVAIAWSCAGVPVVVASASVVSILQGREMMKAVASAEVASGAMLLSVVALVVVLDLGLVAYLSGLFFVLLITLLVQLTILVSAHRPSFRRVTAAAAWSLVTASLPFFAVNLIWAAYTAVDPMILSAFAGSDAVGVYAPPLRLFGTLMFLPVAVTTVVFPRLAALHSSDGPEFERFAGQTIRVSFLASAIVSVGALGLSDDLLVGILGDEFARSGPVILVMALAVLPTAMSMVSVRVAYASDRQKGVSLVGLGALAARVALAAVLVPVFSAVWGNPALGAAVGLLAVECGLTVAFVRFVPREVRTPALWSFIRRGLGALALALAVVAAVLPVLGSLAAAVAGGLLFVLACGLLGVIRLSAAPYSLRTRSPAALLGAPGDS